MSNEKSVATGKVVSMHYKLTLDDGQVVDTSAANEPLTYLHGVGNIVPGLETALEGKAAGDTVKVVVAPEDGYGAHHEEAIHKVERSVFPADARVEAGIRFQAMDQDKNPIIGTITAVEDENVTVDFNHPLAGRTLEFDVEITGVREATDDERQHGHVHDPDDPHH